MSNIDIFVLFVIQPIEVCIGLGLYHFLYQRDIEMSRKRAFKNALREIYEENRE